MPPYGLPIFCPKCPPKKYFGVLKNGSHKTEVVRLSSSDTCPNCGALLVTRIQRKELAS